MISGPFLSAMRLAVGLFFLAGSLRDINSIIDIEWLWQVFECAALVSRNCTIEIGVCRHDDDGQVRIIRREMR